MQPTSVSQSNLAQKIAKWKAGLADLGRRNPLENVCKLIVTEAVTVVVKGF